MKFAAKTDVGMANYRTIQDVIENIDWKLLKKQKRTLEKLIISPCNAEVATVPAKELNDVWGLIELIEKLEDIHTEGAV